jgi:hypothetical protein
MTKGRGTHLANGWVLILRRDVVPVAVVLLAVLALWCSMACAQQPGCD